MSEVSQFFDSSEYQLREYSAQDFSEMFDSFISDGLVHTNNKPNLNVIKTDDYSVKLTNGKAMIKGHLYNNTSEKLFEIKPLENTFNRIDRLVIRYDNTPEVKDIKSFVIEGIPSITPEAPSLTRNDDVYELSLYQITVTPNGVQLVDERFNNEVCGLSDSRFSIPLDDMKVSFHTFKDQLNDDYNNWIQNLEQEIEVTDLRQDIELLKKSFAEILMQRYLDGKAGTGERGYFYDTLSDTKKIDTTNTTALIDTDKMTINLNAGVLNAHVTWKPHAIGFVASGVKHYHTRPIGQLLEVVETAYGGSNEIKLNDVKITISEVI